MVDHNRLPGSGRKTDVSGSRRSDSGSERRQRGHHVAVRCTAAELASLDAAAERAGLTRGAFLRAAALGKPGPRAARRPVVEKAELARLLGQIGHVGSNLNQLARAGNSGHHPEWPVLEAVLAEVQAVARAIMRALGRDH